MIIFIAIIGLCSICKLYYIFGRQIAFYFFQVTLQQMFDFLKNLQHKHHAPMNTIEEPHVSLSSSEQDIRSQSLKKDDQLSSNQGKLVISPRLPLKQPRKKIQKAHSIVANMQSNSKIVLDKETISIFNKLLTASESNIGALIKQKLSQRRLERQRKVYLREMAQDGGQYLSQAAKHIDIGNRFVQLTVQSTVNSIINQISDEIVSSKLEVQLERKRFKEHSEQRKFETLKLIKLRESELHNKIGELSVELDQAVEKRSFEIVNKNAFDLDSIKTKIAEDFTKEKQRERQEKRLKLEKLQEKKREMEIKEQELQKERAEQIKKEKHDKIVQQYAEKQKIKEERQEIARSEQLHFRQFLKQRKQVKPLYEQMQEQFEKKVKQQKKQKYNILKQKMTKYEPLNIEVLEMHEEKYQQLKKEDRERKQAELELAKQENRLRKKILDQKIYKGKYRYMFLQEMVEEQAKVRQKEAEKQAILMRKHAYSLEVKQKHKPAIDPLKRHQIQELVGSHKQRARKYATPNRVNYSDHYSTISTHRAAYSEPEVDPKKEGKKYHRMFKQYIRDKIQKGEVRSEAEQSEPTLQPRPNYLKQLRQKYEGRIPSKSTRLEHEIQGMKQGEDYRMLMIKAQQFQNKAKQRQIKLRNVAHHPAEEAELEEDYLCAIKAKMELINQMD